LGACSEIKGRSPKIKYRKSYRYHLSKVYYPEVRRIISQNFINNFGSYLKKLTAPDSFHKKVYKHFLLENLLKYRKIKDRISHSILETDLEHNFDQKKELKIQKKKEKENRKLLLTLYSLS